MFQLLKIKQLNTLLRENLHPCDILSKVLTSTPGCYCVSLCLLSSALTIVSLDGILLMFPLLCTLLPTIPAYVTLSLAARVVNGW